MGEMTEASFPAQGAREMRLYLILILQKFLLLERHELQEEFAIATS